MSNKGLTIFCTSCIALLGMFMYFGLKATETPIRTGLADSEQPPIYPCDIYSNEDDWCQPYIDYGYANGAIMAQRILGEQKWLEGNGHYNGEHQTCEQVVESLYDTNVASSRYDFPTRIRDIKK